MLLIVITWQFIASSSAETDCGSSFGVRTAAEPNRFARVSMAFAMAGVSQAEAEALVETYRQR